MNKVENKWKKKIALRINLRKPKNIIVYFKTPFFLFS